MDLILPGESGIELIRLFKPSLPAMKVLAFSDHQDPQVIYRTFQAGADGYLLKSSSREELENGIEEVYHGNAVISQTIANELVNFFRRRRVLWGPSLSPTERAILEEFDQGAEYKAVAPKLGMSVNTLRTHVRNILFKTGAHSMAEANFLRRQARSL